ncbi:MAG: GDYXXLXY domain-containing protein [Polyangiales bacterium]
MSAWDRRSLVAVLVAILGIVALMARAEYRRQRSQSWQLPIEAYDPRDILRGHYLRYRFRLPDAVPRHSCQGRDCCLCLRRTEPSGIDAAAHKVACDVAQRCAGWLGPQALNEAQRYYIPETSAAALERALGAGEAALKLRVSLDGRITDAMLYVGGKPWRSSHNAP